jgi:16S rRNA (uracil1498-N3)-methyltransferase
MPHFFVDPKDIQDGRFRLGPTESRHVATVLRKKPGDTLSLFDGEDRSYQVRLSVVTAPCVEGTILESHPLPVLPYALHLFQGLPKNDKFEFILEKMTELGVAEVSPLITERTIAKISIDSLPVRLNRWEKILLAATKQCGRGHVPTVSAPISFDEAMSRCSSEDLTLFPWEGEEDKSLRQALRASTPKIINIFIGPEGGFSFAEVERARRQGAVTVSLGPHILRTETAGLAVASALLYEYAS